MRSFAVFTDFSLRSALALKRAEALAAGANADLLIVHAVDDSLPKHILDHRIAEAQDLLRQEADAISQAKVRWKVAIGDIFWALHQAAIEGNAEVMVTGDHRRNALRDLCGDTTVERLIRVCAVPVLIARTPVSSSYRHAVIGVESEEGGELIEKLAGFGKAAPARTTVLHALTAPAEGLLSYAGVERELRDNYRDQFVQEAHSRLTASLTNAPIPVNITVTHSLPATALAEFAQSEGCDLVAVSSHGRRAFLRGILGSVSSQLIRHGSTDVLIVPRIVTHRGS